MSEKTDRVIWQVTSHQHHWSPNIRQNSGKDNELYQLPEIHTPQEQSPVLQDSLKSTDYIHSLETLQHSLQFKKTAQSMDSLQSTPSHSQTAQEEHRVATKANSGTANEPKSPHVTWSKSLITINQKTHPLPTTKGTFYMNMLMYLRELELYQVAHTI